MKPVLWIVFVCLVVGSALLFYIDRLNQLTQLRLEIPQHVKELKIVQEENEALQYEIDRFESPIYLMELLKKPEYSHLKFPRKSEVIVIEEAKP
ncbi:MAG: hypothetical protein KDK62_04055 [Chlamydiia bacterium]|nr:hypothetical protein [Chlamydiia bacterium]